MAQKHEFVLHVNVASTKANSNKGLSRLATVASFIGMVALIAFVGTVMNSQSGESHSLAQTAVKAASEKAHQAKKETLAVKILTSAVHSTPEQLRSVLRKWRDNQISNLDPFGGKQMLVQEKSVTSMLDDSSSKICASKDTVIGKLSGLASQLETDIANLNATDVAKLKAKGDSYQAWLDSESKYRLMEQKQKDAKEGATYAAEKYEKWTEAVHDTQERYNKLAADYAAAKVSDAQEIALLQNIIQLFGKLKTLKSEAAPSLKATDAATASPAAAAAVDRAELQAKVVELQKLAAKAKNLQLAALASKSMSLARLTRLAGAGEVIDLIQNIINQLLEHDSALAADLASAEKELIAHQEKLAKYQVSVVDLSNAADKAHNEAQVANLERQNLAGTKISSEEEYTAEHDDYILSLPPLQEEYAVLQEVIEKVKAICP